MPNALTNAGSYGASPEARMLVFVLGVVLCVWTCSRLGKRALLISVGAILLSIGLGLIAFAQAPAIFDRVAYTFGVKYPPLLYLIVLLLCISGVLLHLASRISVLDTRCRRLTQEIAFLKSERVLETHVLEAGDAVDVVQK